MGILSRMSKAVTGLSKYYYPYTWKDKPSIESPINAANLNHIESGVNELDNRILVLAQDKADKTDMANVLINFEMDDATGVMTFTRLDGSKVEHDTAVEKIALNCYLEDNNFVLELADGTKQKVSLAKFIDAYTFTSTDTIRITVNGKDISADIPDGKITLAKLEPTIMSTIRQYVLDAQTAKGVAEQAAGTAQGWAIGGTGFEENSAKYYAEQSKRYSVGGIEEGDAEDNAKHYCQKSKEYMEAAQTVSAVEIATTERAGIVKPDGSTITVDVDGIIHGAPTVSAAADVTATDTQGVAGDAGGESNMQALIDAVSNKVVNELVSNTALVEKLAGYIMKSQISNDGLTTEEGYVADARQLNPSIPDTLAGKIAALNSNLAGQEYVLLDLNTLTDSSQNGYTKSCNNVPPGTGNGYLEVVSNKRGLALQRYTPYSNSATYIRQMLADGTWSSWQYSIVNVTSANIAAVTIQPGTFVITPTNLTFQSGDIPIVYGTGGHGAHMIITPSVVSDKWNITRRNPYSSALSSTGVKLYILRTG